LNDIFGIVNICFKPFTRGRHQFYRMFDNDIRFKVNKLFNKLLHYSQAQDGRSG